MKATTLALMSLGCLGALNASAEQAMQNLMPVSAAIEDALSARQDLNANEQDADWGVAGDSENGDVRRHPQSGLKFDLGILDGLRNTLGFWPSIHWLNSANAVASMASLGYTWRNLKLEGAVIRGRDSDQSRNTELIKLDSTAKRLSYNLGPNWALRISRGYHSSPDHFGQNAKIRRSTLSATYFSSVGNSPWNTTFAWGRGSSPYSSNRNAYLLESAFKMNEVHTIFGRVERAGNDELFREEEASHQQSYAVNKYTLGYLYDIVNLKTTKFGIGGLASTRSVPSELNRYYGNNNTSYMVFLRLQLQFSGN